jgi:hypothetical protein
LIEVDEFRVVGELNEISEIAGVLPVFGLVHQLI